MLLRLGKCYCFALLVALPLQAMSAGPVAPDAGSILQQIRPAPSAPPSLNEPSLRVEPEDSATFQSDVTFMVKSLRITGNTLYPEPILHALVADAEGQELTLSDLNNLANRITAYYRDHGYLLVRAVIPAQAIENGVVSIEVREARYGGIDLDNRSQVNDKLLQSTLDTLQRGQVISSAELDRTLLLLSDIPGIVPNATLKPGQREGTSDLAVDVAPGPTARGNVMLDDQGNRYIGRTRLGGSGSFINLLQHGDVLTVSGLSSGGGMNYGRLSYDYLLNGLGTRTGGAYSTLHYRLGYPIAALGVNGTAEVYSWWLRHPFSRSPDSNFYVQLQYEQKTLRDDINVSGIHTDRHIDNWTVNLSGDYRDALLSGAINKWSANWTSGKTGFDNGAAQLADAATAKIQGRFSKWGLNATRLQNLDTKNSVYLNLARQWANRNLDSAEKMIAGGADTVRAYDMGAVAGDEGLLFIAELRHELGLAWRGQWQAIVFMDMARLTVNHDAWTPGTNHATLSGAGAGLNWVGPEQWNVTLSLAKPTGPIPALTIAPRTMRAWFGANRSF